LLKYHPSTRVRVAVAAVLKWRRPKYPVFIRFILEKSDILGLTKKVPGMICEYIGVNTPVTELEENKCEGYVQVNPREFMLAVQRLINVKGIYDEEVTLSHPSCPYRSLLGSLNLSNINSLSLPFDPNTYLQAEDNIDLDEREQISQLAIKALANALNDEVAAVRETAASSLGSIGLPEELGALDNLIIGIKDPDPNVRAMKAWAIGRLGPSAGHKAIKPLLELLKDNYWKVKTSACIAIGCIGEQAASYALALLLKVKCQIIVDIKGWIS